MEVQAQVQAQAPAQGLVVEKEGESLNSPYPERRRLKVKLNLELSEALEALEATKYSLFFPMDFRVPWWKAEAETYKCAHCEARKKYEASNPSAWKRNYCMRHYLLEHLFEIIDYFIHDNKPSRLVASPDSVELKVCSWRYDYHVVLYRTHATVSVIYSPVIGKESKYTFKYNNHDKGLLPSSYNYLRVALWRALNEVERLLDRAERLVPSWYNLEVKTPSERILVSAIPIDEEDDP